MQKVKNQVLPGGAAERRSGKVKEHQGVGEGDRLVEPHPAVPEAKAAGGSSTRSRGPPTLLPPSRRRGPKRRGGNGNRHLLGAAGKSPPGLPHLPSCP